MDHKKKREEKVKKRNKRDKTGNIKRCKVSAPHLSTFSVLAAAAAQIYKLFILHWLVHAEKKKKHIQVNDKRRTTGDMTSE